MSVLTVREIAGVNWVIQTSRAPLDFSVSLICQLQEGHVGIFYLLADSPLALGSSQF